MNKLLTHEDLSVEGIEFLHIYNLRIEQNINEHAYATIRGEVDSDYAKYFSEHVTEIQIFTICAREDILFKGILENTSAFFENTASILEVKLISTSKLLDYTLENHSFQNSHNTYFSLIQEAIVNDGQVYFNGNDRVTNGLVMQYNETKWNFIKRMAGCCCACVCVDSKSDKPKVYIGGSGNTIDEETIVEYGKTRISGKSEKLVNVGEQIEPYLISQVISELEQGVFISHFVAITKEQLPLPLSIATGKQSFAGKIFTGKVESVQGDKVKVHLTEIDESFDKDGDWLFPYSTIYSSKSDSGFYCMPQENDYVRVFFPTERAEDAFAAAGPNARGGCDNKDEKKFESPTGMTIHYTKSGICLSCKGKKVYIDFNNAGSINIKANTSIQFCTPEILSINAADRLTVRSDEKIYMGVEESFIQLGKVDGEDKADVYSGMIFVK